MFKHSGESVVKGIVVQEGTMSEKSGKAECQCYMVDKKDEDPTNVFCTEQPHPCKREGSHGGKRASEMIESVNGEVNTAWNGFRHLWRILPVRRRKMMGP